MRDEAEKERFGRASLVAMRSWQICPHRTGDEPVAVCFCDRKETAEFYKILHTFNLAQPGVFHDEMNRLESKKHSPAQVFAQFTSASESEGIPGARINCKHEGEYASDNRREIQITESGEVSLPPDKARVSVVCSNAKVSDQYFTMATVNCFCMYI